MSDDAQIAPAGESAPAQETAPSAAPAEVSVAESAPTPEAVPTSAAEVASENTPAAASSPTQSSAPQPGKEPRHWTDADRAKAAAVHHQQTEAELAKIVEFAKKHPKVTNDDIEKLLHVSDATASRYLKLLVERGVLKKEGSGRGVSYVLANV